ncbi:hypothetical protein IHE49_14495 [Rhodanobacter sp. 7MK24]|uniref:hypothetical protein n=1 Tax=Rhodanobacter sp. 7MK24 TaxID=2775922 RepID=UPI00177A9D8E|nr:hypothetical protein [Rhodanobacter sp. 7MK24]MBD8881692.1 hypothetical protein [Rhodanobacter sp. 7MK24]
MTNKSTIDRVLMAYRPLYLRGLLLDGQYRLPSATARKPGTPRRRMLLAALTDLRHVVASTENKP